MNRLFLALGFLYACSNNPATPPDGGTVVDASDEGGGVCSPSDPGGCVRSSGCAGTRTCDNGVWSACTCPPPDLRYKLVEPGPYTGAIRSGGFDQVDANAKDLAAMGFVVTTVVHNAITGYTLFGMKSVMSKLKYAAKTIQVTGASADTDGKTLQAEGYVVTAAVLSSGGIHLLVGTRVVNDTFTYEGNVITTPLYAVESELNSLGAQGFVVTACLSPSTDYYLFASRVVGANQQYIGKESTNNAVDTKKDLANLAAQGFVPTSYCIRENDMPPGPYDLTYQRDPAVASVSSQYDETSFSSLDAHIATLTGNGYFVNLAFGYYAPWQFMGTKR